MGSLTNSQTNYQSCGCIGPQNGEPLCPCMMRGIIKRDGRYIKPEQDLGPISRSQELAEEELIIFDIIRN